VRGGRAALLLLAAVSFPACESTQEPCPGEPLATLRFAQPSDAGGATATSSCAFASAPRGVEFTGTITRLPDGAAGLCLQRALGRLKRGTLTLDVLSVSDAEAGQLVGTCPCKLDVVERLQGTLHRDAGGAIDGFAGELSDEVALAPDRPADRQPAACLDGTAAGCGPLVRPAPGVPAGTCAVRVPLKAAP
jgi:hypothetical protein